MKLVIVESPTKAKTISRFLGKGYSVKSSYGHIRDLPTKELAIDVENNFEPTYEIPPKAIMRVKELKKQAQTAEKVILATDEDREGEAISWHLAQALGLKEVKNYERIVFHEITKPAIEEALKNPRKIDIDLVDAQQARRILDRLVGYKLSPFLWKKVRRGLSAGRVQSVALRFICEREREIEKFKSEKYFSIPIELKKKDASDLEKFKAEIIERNGEKIEIAKTIKLFAGDYKTKKTVFSEEKTARETAKDIEKSEIKITDIAEKETTRHPNAPFTTSTLQQSAINNLGYSAKKTMMAAQKLYEKGFITYMRTDSVNLSLESMISARKAIENKFGKEYALPNPRFFKNKSKNAQEAHEAIRPAYPDKDPEALKKNLDHDQYQLYRLIWERMLASQMAPAIFDSVKVSISAENKGSKNKYLLSANGSTIKFEGFLKVNSFRKANGENLLPPLKISDALEVADINVEEKMTAPPPRYSEATLVKVLEENGIGRPSTYAPTISTIIERKYVDKNEEKRLFPLEIGLVVNDLLVEHFLEIVDINFTATIEEDFDEIAEGKIKWVPVIRDFYNPFIKHLKSKTKEVKKEAYQEKIGRKCPECGGELILKHGRFGQFIACANYPKCKYTEKTDEDKKMERENSGEICEFCGGEMAVKKGKYGFFLGCSNYPNCKNIKKIENKTGIACPKCGKGDIVERKSKKGRLFYGCSNYPNCNFALWNKPTGETCPKCGSLLIFAAKGKAKCSNKECDYIKN
jgi:DNA topoisomerase I